MPKLTHTVPHTLPGIARHCTRIVSHCSLLLAFPCGCPSSLPAPYIHTSPFPYPPTSLPTVLSIKKKKISKKEEGQAHTKNAKTPMARNVEQYVSNARAMPVNAEQCRGLFIISLELFSSRGEIHMPLMFLHLAGDGIYF